MKKISNVSRFLLLMQCLLTSMLVDAFDYHLYGGENCYLSSVNNTAIKSLLRCPLKLTNLHKNKRIRVRIYTQEHHPQPTCHLSGSNDLAVTAYRFTQFKQLPLKENNSRDMIQEVQLTSQGLFFSKSEGETWRMRYEIQCPISTAVTIEKYSVMQRTDADSSKERWVMY